MPNFAWQTHGWRLTKSGVCVCAPDDVYFRHVWPGTRAVDRFLRIMWIRFSTDSHDSCWLTFGAPKNGFLGKKNCFVQWNHGKKNSPKKHNKPWDQYGKNVVYEGLWSNSFCAGCRLILVSVLDAGLFLIKFDAIDSELTNTTTWLLTMWLRDHTSGIESLLASYLKSCSDSVSHSVNIASINWYPSSHVHSWCVYVADEAWIHILITIQR